jgi:hypothetical protein
MEICVVLGEVFVEALSIIVALGQGFVEDSVHRYASGPPWKWFLTAVVAVNAVVIVAD